MSTKPVDFSDLEDKAFWDDTPAPEPVATVEIPGFVEDCPKCNGTGRWRGIRKCFKCKGTGKLQFKTSPSQRTSARKSAARSKAKKAADNAATFLAWMKEHDAVCTWFQTNADSSFAVSLYQAGLKYGHLTEGQENAVYKAIARDEDGREGFKAWCESYEGVLEWLTTEVAAGNEFAGSLLSAGNRYGSLTAGQLNAVQRNIDENKTTAGAESDLDLFELQKGYYAVPDGDTRLKIAIRRPGKNSR